MAIQFPPLNLDDPAPENGDQFLDVVSGNVWEYDKEQNSWTQFGLLEYGAFQYRGDTLITSKAPINTQPGYLYSVADGGIADSSYVGLGGTDVPVHSLLAVGPQLTWSIVALAGSTPFVRVNGKIVPNFDGDDLDMEQGSYVLSSLSDIP